MASSQHLLFTPDGITCDKCGEVSPNDYLHTLHHSRHPVDGMCHTQRNALIPITYLYPEVEGAERTKLRSRASNLANRINSGTQSPFDAYDAEAKSRGTDIYIRINITQRRRRQLDDF